MLQAKMEIGKLENGKQVPVGDIVIFVPLLSDCGFDVEPNGKDDDGMPTYEDDRHNYVFACLLAATRAAARNKLLKGTVELKEGNKIAETLEELIAGNEGNRSGEALKTWRDYLVGFKTFLGSKGKSAAWVAGVYEVVKNVAGIPYQPTSRKKAIVSLVAEHVLAMTAEDAVRFTRAATKITEAAQTENPLDDGEF